MGEDGGLKQRERHSIHAVRSVVCKATYKGSLLQLMLYFFCIFYYVFVFLLLCFFVLIYTFILWVYDVCPIWGVVSFPISTPLKMNVRKENGKKGAFNALWTPLPIDSSPHTTYTFLLLLLLLKIKLMNNNFIRQLQPNISIFSSPLSLI